MWLAKITVVFGFATKQFEYPQDRNSVEIPTLGLFYFLQLFQIIKLHLQKDHLHYN